MLAVEEVPPRGPRAPTAGRVASSRANGGNAAATTGAHRDEDAWVERRYSTVSTAAVATTLVGFLTFSTITGNELRPENCAAAPDSIALVRSIDRLLVLITVSSFLVVIYSPIILKYAAKRLNVPERSPATEMDDRHFVRGLQARTEAMGLTFTFLGLASLTAHLTLAILVCSPVKAVQVLAILVPCILLFITVDLVNWLLVLRRKPHGFSEVEKPASYWIVYWVGGVILQALLLFYRFLAAPVRCAAALTSSAKRCVSAACLGGQLTFWETLNAGDRAEHMLALGARAASSALAQLPAIQRAEQPGVAIAGLQAPDDGTLELSSVDAACPTARSSKRRIRVLAFISAMRAAISCAEEACDVLLPLVRRVGTRIRRGDRSTRHAVREPDVSRECSSQCSFWAGEASMKCLQQVGLCLPAPGPGAPIPRERFAPAVLLKVPARDTNINPTFPAAMRVMRNRTVCCGISCAGDVHVCARCGPHPARWWRWLVAGGLLRLPWPRFGEPPTLWNNCAASCTPQAVRECYGGCYCRACVADCAGAACARCWLCLQTTMVGKTCSCGGMICEWSSSARHAATSIGQKTGVE